MTLRTLGAGTAGAALCVALAAAQVPIPPAPSGLVMGTVVDSISGKPVPAATISIGNSRVRSDDEGRFLFTELARGQYSIEASKPGYFGGAYGRRRPDGPSATLSLGADERIGNLRIEIFRHAAISGKVIDEAGEPLVAARVEVLEKTWLGGRLVLVHGGATVTDDRGEYRVGSLSNGEFVVAAIYETLPVLKPDGDFVYPVHYFPGGTSVELATPVSLAVGDDRSGIDIQLRLSAASRVSGILRGPNGPVTGAVVLTTNLNDLTSGVDLEAAEETSEPSGRFTFLAVPSGSYVARAVVRPPPLRTENSTAPTRLMWASTPFAVDGTNISNLDVLLHPGFRIAGAFVFESASGTRRPGYELIRRMTATIDSVDVDMRALGDAGSMTIELSGAFSSRELPPGRYFVKVDNVPPGWTLKRISAAGRDLSNSTIRLDADVSGLTFTFSDRPTDLGGFVRADAGVIEGSTVLVFPRNRASWTDFGRRPLGLRATRTSRDGSFRFAGLPPGDYLVIAVDDAGEAGWQQPARLEKLAPLATSLTLGEGEKRSLDLRQSVIR